MCVCLNPHGSTIKAVRGVGDVNQASPDGRTNTSGGICGVPPRSATVMPSKGNPGMGSLLNRIVFTEKVEFLETSRKEKDQ